MRYAYKRHRLRVSRQNLMHVYISSLYCTHAYAKITRRTGCVRYDCIPNTAFGTRANRASDFTRYIRRDGSNELYLRVADAGNSPTTFIYIYFELMTSDICINMY